MATKDRLATLDDDAFDFIGSTARETAAPETAAHEAVPDLAPAAPTKQISARIPVDLYRRLKLHLIDAPENQEELLVRLLKQELGG